MTYCLVFRGDRFLEYNDKEASFLPVYVDEKIVLRIGT